MRGSKGVEITRRVTHIAYLCTMVALLLAIGGCGKQLTRMEENQVKLQAMMAANARELATLSSQIHTGAGKLEAGIQDLDADAQGIATHVQTVQDDQRKLQETVVAGNQALDARATQLREGQESLQSSMTQVQTVADHTASDLGTLSQRHTALHETVQANQRELNGRMGAVVTNQETLQAGITHLQQADAGLAKDIATVAGRQDAFSTQIRDNHKQVTERLATLIAGQERFSNDLLTARDTLQNRTQAITDKLNILEQNQRTHQTGIDRLFATADQTAATITAIAAAQTAMQESLNANHGQTTGRLTSLAESQRSMQISLDTLNTKADQAATDSSAAVASLQDSLRTGREAIAGQIGVSLQNQQAIQTAVQDLTGKAAGMAMGVSAVRAEQTAAHEASKTNQDAIITAMAGLSDGQRTLRNEVGMLTTTSGQTALAVLTMNNGQATFQQAMQTGMNGLHDTADQTAAEVRGMAEQQTAFQDGIKASNETLVARTTAIEANQQALSAEIGKTAKVIDRAYADLTGVSVAQDTLQTTFAKHSDQINDRMARIESSQKSLGDGQDVLVAMTGQTAIDVLALTNGHTDLQRSIRAGSETVLNQTAALHQNQKALANQLDILTATAGQTALDVFALESDQTAMARSVQAGLADLGQRTDAVAANQQQMHSSVDVLTATTGQMALNVTNVAGRQDALQKAIQSHSDSTTGQMAQLAESQQKMQGGLDTVTATTGQTALDVTNVAGRQDALQKAIQGYSESTTGQMAQLAESQQKMQTGLDTVTATTGQTALDVAAASEAQAKSEQNAQTSRMEVAAKLDAIAQDHQGWLQRFDATQARIQAMADSIALLDQQLVKLQGALQAGIQNTTTAADTNGQQRQQFEAKIAQDVQAMLDAIAQLRQAQTQLQEQMSQVHKTTQNQAETLKATLDQIKPPTEVKVSDAVNSPAPVTVQTGQ